CLLFQAEDGIRERNVTGVQTCALPIIEEHKTIKLLQQEVDNYIGQFEEGYFSPLALTARLAEELGELAREVNHFYGEKPKKNTEEEKTIEEEIGDLLFVIICFANSLHIDLEVAHNRVMEKFRTRDKDRWTKKGQGSDGK